MRTDRYPSVPGSYAHAPETSREAGESVAPIAASIRARIRDVIADAAEIGVTSDGVARALDLTPVQVRARVAELHAIKIVADSGRRSVLDSGRRGVVWVLAEHAPAPEPDHGPLFNEAA